MKKNTIYMLQMWRNFSQYMWDQIKGRHGGLLIIPFLRNEFLGAEEILATWSSCWRKYIDMNGQERKQEGCGNSHSLLTRYLRVRWQWGPFWEDPDRNGEHVLGSWRKGDSVIRYQRTWLNYVLVLEFCPGVHFPLGPVPLASASRAPFRSLPGWPFQTEL